MSDDETRVVPVGTGLPQPGYRFGSRYQINRLLGEGGMGAVYQAWDHVLEVPVALKVIRPAAAVDSETAGDLERRFKRELLLARQVTHKNVVRIHDLGEIDGVTYITMPYIDGADVATILKRDGRLPLDRALAIARDVASGLAAAHQAGVVHRDLKPANIMVGADGVAVVMDFGIARSTSAAFGKTIPGAIVGTFGYMAPEQARGEAVDERADIYAFGLILRDMVGGMSAPSIEAVIARCTQPNPASRYQRMTDVITDLEREHLPLALAKHPSVTRRSILAICLIAALATTGWAVRARFLTMRPSATAATPTMALAILPFHNASGDPTLNSLGFTLSEVLRTELGQSSRVRTVSSGRLHQVLQDLRITPGLTLAPTDLARISDFTSATRVLWGRFTKFGSAIRIDATLQDLDHDQATSINATAPNEASVLSAVAQLAETVQQELARGSRGVLNDLKATAWKPSTNSIGALRLYDEGRELARLGKHSDALKRFEGARDEDRNFALAVSALAQSHATLGHDQEALQISRQAISLSDKLPLQEKYLISAQHYQIVNDISKAIESYENLVKVSPGSAMIWFDLGGLYERRGVLDQAHQDFAKAVELDPKFVDGLLALGRIEIKRGRPQDSLPHLNAALTQAIQLDNDEARANILQATGIAYKRMNRPHEALKRYEESLEIKQKLGQKRGMAASFGEIAQIEELLGQPREAQQHYQDALILQREIGDSSGTATSLVNLAVLIIDSFGRPNQALPLLREALQIRREAGNVSGEAMVLNNIGSAYLSKGEYLEAQTQFERALDLRTKSEVASEMADTLHNLAETQSALGHYDQALSLALRALEFRRRDRDKRGEAIESYSIGTIFDYQSRYGAAIKSKEAALQAFRDLKYRDMWLGEILGGYGNSLSLSGRMDDATKSLDEAMTVARELKNQSLIARTSLLQSNRLYYSGDMNGASSLAELASQIASRASDRSLAVLTQTAVAATAGAEHPNIAVASKLAGLVAEAERLGLRSLALDITILRTQTLLKLGDRGAARLEADRAVAKAETLGIRLSLAKAHHVRAEVLRLGGDTKGREEYALALRLLDEVKSEDGNQNVLKRKDVGSIYADCVRWSRAATQNPSH